MPKPMTKALHTVRVVRAIAAQKVRDGQRFAAAAELFACILALLGNAAPTDAALLTACIEACAEVLS